LCRQDSDSQVAANFSDIATVENEINSIQSEMGVLGEKIAQFIEEIVQMKEMNNNIVMSMREFTVQNSAYYTTQCENAYMISQQTSESLEFLVEECESKELEHYSLVKSLDSLNFRHRKKKNEKSEHRTRVKALK
jgi:regulator of replication initiation timing